MSFPSLSHLRAARASAARALTTASEESSEQKDENDLVEGRSLFVDTQDFFFFIRRMTSVLTTSVAFKRLKVL